MTQVLFGSRENQINLGVNAYVCLSVDICDIELRSESVESTKIDSQIESLVPTCPSHPY